MSSLTLRAGLAGLTTLHIFEFARFSPMLFSPLGFPSRSGACPEGIALNLPSLRLESLVTVYAAHFLASSVFVKKPQRIMALSLIMVLCLLVYRLAEQRLRIQLAETEKTIPDQVNKPTQRPTMRWVFQCFEGIELLHIHTAEQPTTLILRLQPLHEQILALLGPPYQRLYQLSP